MTKEIKSDPTACEAFFLVVVEAHIITLTMNEFGIVSSDATPTHDIFSEENFFSHPPPK